MLELPFPVEEVCSALLRDEWGYITRGGWVYTAFWKSCWLMREQVMMIFEKFHRTGKFVRSLNATFVFMIRRKVELSILRISG